MPIVSQGGAYTLRGAVITGTGYPADATSLILTITDPSDDVLAGFPVAIPPIVHDGLGQYHYDWTVALDADLGDYTALWQGFLLGVSITGSEIVEVVAPGTISVESYTYDPTTTAGKVRLLCQDFDMTNPIFTDREIQAFLDLNDSVIRYSAAQALLVIAASEAYIMKRIQTLSLAQDGPAVAEALRKLAAELTRQEDEPSGTDGWDWAEQVFDTFSEREALRNAALRGQL